MSSGEECSSQEETSGGASKPRPTVTPALIEIQAEWKALMLRLRMSSHGMGGGIMSFKRSALSDGKVFRALKIGFMVDTDLKTFILNII